VGLKETNLANYLSSKVLIDPLDDLRGEVLQLHRHRAGAVDG
jgi:hypothetical protein